MPYVKFPETLEEDECTVQFMQVVRQNDIRKSLAARRRSSVVPSRLDIVLEKTDEHSVNSSAKTATNDIGRLSIRDSTKSKTLAKTMHSIDENAAQKAKTLQPLAPVYQTPLQQHSQQPKTETPTSPTEYQETIPAATTIYSQESRFLLRIYYKILTF